VTILTIITVVFFPQHLFANRLNYKNFTVCSNNKIDNDIKTILNNAMTLVEKSELYDSNYKYNIILCYNTLYNKIDDLLAGAGPAATPRGNNILIKVRMYPHGQPHLAIKINQR